MSSAQKLINFTFPDAPRLLLSYIDKKLRQTFDGPYDLEEKLNKYFYAKRNLRKHSAQRFLLNLSRTLFPSVFHEAQAWLQKRLRVVRCKERAHREEILDKVRSLTSEKVKVVAYSLNRVRLVTIKEIKKQRLLVCPNYHSVFLPPPFRPDTYYRQILQLSNSGGGDKAPHLQIKDFNNNPIVDASVSWYLSRVLPPVLTNIVLDYWFTPNSLRPLQQFMTSPSD